jgi:hypothetical protein
VDVAQAARREQVFEDQVRRGADARLVAMLSSPGAPARTRNRSSSVRNALPAGTSTPKVTPETWMMGVTSRTGSHSTFCTYGAAEHRLRHLRDRVAVGLGLLQDRHRQRAAGAAAVSEHWSGPAASRQIGEQAQRGRWRRRPPRHPQRDRLAAGRAGAGRRAQAAGAPRTSARRASHGVRAACLLRPAALVSRRSLRRGS